MTSADGRADPRTMLGLEARPSDSPYVDVVWRSATRGGVMTSVASSRAEIVFWWEPPRATSWGGSGTTDHPHLARSLTRFIGHSASELRAPRTSLSLLYAVDDRTGR